MELQWVGVVAAAATFVGVWLGHVAVRKVEAMVEKLWIPMAVALLLGLGFEICALLTPDLLLSTAAGILGVTLLWDSFEFWRQQKRVVKGHAPASPHNPRHAHVLMESQKATTLDLLNRDPVGRPVSAEEAEKLVAES